MKIRVAPALFVALIYGSTAQGVPILCQDATVNHMLIDDSQVSACLDAGSGNLTGNSTNDPFLLGVGNLYESAGKSDETNPYNITYNRTGSDNGSWSFDSSFWDDHSDGGAIGFKFGTGNHPDEWFVYSLVPNVTSGEWNFIDLFNTGGGLSHVNLYGIPNAVSEPMTLSLLGFGLIALGYARSRRRTVYE